MHANKLIAEQSCLEASPVATVTLTRIKITEGAKPQIFVQLHPPRMQEQATCGQIVILIDILEILSARFAAGQSFGEVE